MLLKLTFEPFLELLKELSHLCHTHFTSPTTVLVSLTLCTLCFFKPLHKKITKQLSLYSIVSMGVIVFAAAIDKPPALRNLKSYDKPPFLNNEVNNSLPVKFKEWINPTANNEWPYFRWVNTNGLDTILKQDDSIYFDSVKKQIKDSLYNVYTKKNLDLTNKIDLDDTQLRITLIRKYSLLGNQYLKIADSLRYNSFTIEMKNKLLNNLAIKQSEIMLFHDGIVNL